MQPTATLMQMITALCSVVIAGTVLVFTVHTWSDNRNAQLVQIGVSILEIDPKQQDQVKAAREWALDLIEANAGGVTFSPEARAQLLNKQLVVGGTGPRQDGGTPGDTNPGGTPGDTNPGSVGAPATGGDR